jgi:hypothetical protein
VEYNHLKEENGNGEDNSDRTDEQRSNGTDFEQRCGNETHEEDHSGAQAATAVPEGESSGSGSQVEQYDKAEKRFNDYIGNH